MALSFTVLGPSGSGKTTILASMYNELESVSPGIFCPDEEMDPEGFDRLRRAYDELQAMANSEGEKFDVTIKPDATMREYSFTIFGRNDNLVKFYDYPGGWLNTSHPDHCRVVNVLREASVVFVTINAPYLMEKSGQYARRASLKEIESCLIEYLSENREDKFIVFVPIKCEKYTQPTGDVMELNNKIKEVFNGVLTTGQQFCKGHFAAALLPVQTVGNRVFKEFKTDTDGKLIAEGYKKLGVRFNPRNADQPMRYALSFLLKQFDKQFNEKNSVLRRLLSNLFNLFKGNRRLKEQMDAFIRDGIINPEQNSEFEILCGRDLIGC